MSGNIFHDWLETYILKTGIDVDQPITRFGESAEKATVAQVIDGIKAAHPAKQSAVWQKLRNIDKTSGDPIPYFRYLIDEVGVPVGELV